MATTKCPIPGFENVTLTYPDRWAVKHHTLFYSAVREAGEEATQGTQWLYGSVAVCDKIEGLPEGVPVSEWPLELFNWIVQTVYWGSFEKALNPTKNA